MTLRFSSIDPIVGLCISCIIQQSRRLLEHIDRNFTDAKFQSPHGKWKMSKVAKDIGHFLNQYRFFSEPVLLFSRKTGKFTNPSFGLFMLKSST